ncbi:MAG TPA: hypothetical protein VL475_14875 [Planctomycetaceae bacterium]|nr:hypothetical protein [Planctomycetaceae bacterium]
MRAVLRILAGILVGLGAAFALVVAVELFSAVVYPLPEDFDGTMEAMCRHVQNYPQWILAVVVPLWFVTGMAGTWIAQKIGNITAALVVGLLLLAAIVFNVVNLPYPLWFKVANLFAFPIALFAGSRLANRRKPAAAVPAN